MIFKALNALAPRYLIDMLQTKFCASYKLRSNMSTDTLMIPKTKCKTFGDRAFAVVGPREWNSLPTYIRDIKNFDTFKQHLKTYYFKLHFNSS